MSDFPLPPREKNQDGEWRRVGVEFEMAGLSSEEAADAVQSLFGGEKKRAGSFQFTVTDTRFGDFSTELDAHLLKSGKYREALNDLGVSLPDIVDPKTLDRFVEEASQLVVPCEIVTPPIPLPDLGAVDDLRQALHERRALGTGASPAYAFGLHLNPETPDDSVETATAYLRAFALLEDWLREELDLDMTRRLSPYIDPFPDDHVALLADPDYAPDAAKLMADYLHHNPTRNRGLDMLPLFRFMDEDAADHPDVETHLVKARPAFHYRLPNCRIDDPDWTVAFEWRHWLQVERLAADRDALNELGRAYLDRPGLPMRLLEPSWADRVREALA